ncbi:MAG: hypothetical protein M0042_08990 [Nitrospiraceae bacterium]|nr:hypothetical protein [Nitrospiraceae bacterium]
MKKTAFSFLLVLAAIVSLSACGGGGGGGGTDAGQNTNPPGTTPPAWQGTLVTSPAATPIASFTQSIPSQDTGGAFNEIFPGSANVWTMDQDLALIDGFDLQFNYALYLVVGTTPFPADQNAAELTYFTPVLGTAEGVKVAAVSNGATLDLAGLGISSAVAGNYAAFLNATSDSRLQQTLDLTAATGTITVNWREAVSVDPGGLPGYVPSYRVVLRSTDGAELKELLADPAITAPLNYSKDISAYKGQKVVLSFEERSSTSPFGQAYAVIDSVSVTDGATEYATNGNFETGDMTGWTTNTPAEIQNITSGLRTVEDLAVQRSFYTVPNKLWGRWVDVFRNPTAAAIAKTVTYETWLGSDGAGIIYYAPGTNDRALTSWDTMGGRDVGLVFGNAKSVTFTSDDGTGTTGSGIITVAYDITVPAGGSVAIVNFVIMDGVDTGQIAPLDDYTKKAADIDTAAAAIVSGFWTDEQYRTGMTQEQVDGVKNFAN